MATPFLGEIRIFAGDFAPARFAQCDGQLIAIAQNTALFSILGTAFGGDGRTTFALPDFRGRVPVQAGAGRGIKEVFVGDQAGDEQVALGQAEMPAHTHRAGCAAVSGTQTTPAGNVWAKDKSGLSAAYSTTTDGSMMSSQALTPTGDSQPHNNVQPGLVLNFIIALAGTFPSRG